MSRHIAPHRWARAEGAERAKLDRHAATCARCAGERDRVLAARGELPVIRARSAPELGWDGIRARIHWAVSSERRAAERTSGRRSALVIGALGLAGAAALVGGGLAIHAIAGGGDDAAAIAAKQPARPAVIAATAPLPAIAVRPAAVIGLVDRTSGDVAVDGAHATDVDILAKHVVAGDMLATGEGRVDVQFGEGSAFALGPHTKLTIARFDAEAIELALDGGTVDLVVAPRAKGQRFIVHAAGGRDIEVRGTQFRVADDGRGQTRVACRHGLVAVRDAAGGQVEVAGERGVTIARGDGAVATSVVAALSVDDLATLVAATPYALPMWTGADALAQTTAPLSLSAAGHRAVRVDGIEHGAAPLSVRVLPGRHTVEAADARGRFRRVGWVDVALGGAPSHLDVPAEQAPDPGLRKSQFDARRDQKALGACIRQIAKTGMTDTFVRVEIAVDTAGAINMLNIVDTDLPSATAGCIHDALANVTFGAGPSATWTERIDL